MFSKLAPLLLTVIFSVFTSAPATASAQSGNIIAIHFEGNRFLVYLDGPSAGQSCNSAGAGRRYEIDPLTDLGKAQMSFILTAYGMGQSIYISGTNFCPVDTETIIFLKLSK